MTNDWRFSTLLAEENLMSTLVRRDALRNEPDFDPDDAQFLQKHGLCGEWISHGRAAYQWKVRSPLALLLCGLLARATDEKVDPLSIQANSGDYGYNAAGLWKDVIVKHASGHISLRKLRNAPFNNSPFNGKRRLETNWQNTSSTSKEVITALHEMLVEVESMSPSQAEAALLAVFLVAPDSTGMVGKGRPRQDISYPQLVSLVEFADTVANFISLNSDDGRRAQAFVTACLEVALPDRITTPASINDPSRNSPGDVKSLLSAEAKHAGPLFVEVKDKLARRPEVAQFIEEVQSYDGQASAAYAALANTPAAESAVALHSQIPAAEELARSAGIPVVVWKSPLEMLTQATAWTGLPASEVIWLCAHKYLKWLDHLDTGKHNSPADWQRHMLSMGFLDGDLADLDN